MIYMMKHLGKNFSPSVCGDRIKEVYKLDSYKYELVKIGEIDLQDRIQSYASMTNYKELIDKLHSPEEIEQYFPVNINALYADVSAFSQHYMENRELFQNVLSIIEDMKNGHASDVAMKKEHDPDMIMKNDDDIKQQEVNNNG